jgi:hypothetical protein
VGWLLGVLEVLAMSAASRRRERDDVQGVFSRVVRDILKYFQPYSSSPCVAKMSRRKLFSRTTTQGLYRRLVNDHASGILHILHSTRCQQEVVSFSCVFSALSSPRARRQDPCPATRESTSIIAQQLSSSKSSTSSCV